MAQEERGRCACGAITYTLDRDAVAMANHCHCRDCQRATGCGFATFCALPDAAVTVTGTPKGYTVQSDGGRDVTRFFCPDCGTALYSEVAVMPGFKFVKAGTLDDPSWVEVASSMWAASAQPWAPVDASKPSAPGNPG